MWVGINWFGCNLNFIYVRLFINLRFGRWATVAKKAPPFVFSVHSHDFFSHWRFFYVHIQNSWFFTRLLELERSYVLRIWFSFAGFFCVAIEGGRVDRCKFEFYKHWNYLHFINVCFYVHIRNSHVLLRFQMLIRHFMIVYPLVPRIYWALMYVLQLIFTAYTCASAFSNILGGHQLELWVGVVIATAKWMAQAKGRKAQHTAATGRATVKPRWLKLGSLAVSVFCKPWPHPPASTFLKLRNDGPAPIISTAYSYILRMCEHFFVVGDSSAVVEVNTALPG